MPGDGSRGEAAVSAVLERWPQQVAHGTDPDRGRANPRAAGRSPRLYFNQMAGHGQPGPRQAQ